MNLWDYLATLFAQHFPYWPWFEPFLWFFQRYLGIYALTSFLTLLLIVGVILPTSALLLRDVYKELRHILSDGSLPNTRT
jgi:hypothetical protein